MRKLSPFKAACSWLLLGFLLAIPACSAKPSVSSMQTAVAGTLSAAPVQVVEVTQVFEVTQVVEVTKLVEVTAAPAQPDEGTATPTATPTLEATAVITPTATTEAVSAQSVTATPTPVTASGPLNMTLSQYVKKISGMTDLQQKNFLVTLPGKTVAWEARVNNITTDGTIILDNVNGPGRVTLIGIPIETAIKIDIGMFVDFTGMIQKIEGAFFTDIVVVDGKVTRYFAPPTPTPTEPRR